MNPNPSRKGHKRYISVAIAAALCLSTALAGSYVTPAEKVAARSLSEIQSDKNAIQSQLDDVNAKIDDLQGQIDAEEEYQAELTTQIELYRDQIALMDEQISTLEGQIEDKNNEIDQLEGNIDQLEEDIAAKQVEIDDTYEIFKTRMVALYQAGETSSLAMLLSSDSFSDFVTNIQLMQAVSKSDEELVDTLRSQKEEQEVQKQAVEEYKVEVETALEEIKADEEAIILQREEQRIAQSNLEIAYSESETAQEDLEALQAQYENDLEGMLAEEAAVEAELQDFYAEQARQQAAAQQNNSSSSSGSSSNVIADTGDLSFRWPLPGYSYISSPYGSRWGGWHTGIDISGGGVYGASIVAAESGTVIMAQWYSTYGNCVIVDHGGGYSTLYAHMSSIGCSVGDYVTKGQTVGYVGSTGNSTGPHLHFEVRVNGTAQNPQNYVSA